jgi:hypothetical protein
VLLPYDALLSGEIDVRASFSSHRFTLILTYLARRYIMESRGNDPQDPAQCVHPCFLSCSVLNSTPPPLSLPLRSSPRPEATTSSVAPSHGETPSRLMPSPRLSTGGSGDAHCTRRGSTPIPSNGMLHMAHESRGPRDGHGGSCVLAVSAAFAVSFPRHVCPFDMLTISPLQRLCQDVATLLSTDSRAHTPHHPTAWSKNYLFFISMPRLQLGCNITATRLRGN